MKASDLPTPSSEAKAHSEQLTQHIAEMIDATDGTIGFRDFMDACLYAPGLGYYAAGNMKFGESGDFITAPEISPLFGQCLANLYLDHIKTQPNANTILEFGAGTGALAKSLLERLQAFNQLPAHYYILEVSPDLKARQKATLQDALPQFFDHIVWLDALPDHFNGVVFANEVIDAMPVHRVTLKNQSWHEVFVTHEGSHFSTELGALSSKALERACSTIDHAPLPEGYTTEINLMQDAWIRSLFSLCHQTRCYLIDYGYTTQDYFHPERRDGTLMCYYQHRGHDNPFYYPGLQDITAHVNFSTLAESAHNIGFSIDGFSTQANFLYALGLLSLETVKDRFHDDPILQQAIRQLTHPNAMGEMFKVLALSKNIDTTLNTFANIDQRFRL